MRYRTTHPNHSRDDCEKERTLRIQLTSWQYDQLRRASSSFGLTVERWARLALVEAAEDSCVLDACDRSDHR